MKDEELDTPESIDEAWEIEDEEIIDAKEDEEVVVEEEIEEVATGDEEEQEIEAPNTDTDDKVEDEKTEEKKPVDWEALGLDMFKGKTQEQVAEQIGNERKSLGHVTNQLGDLRRQIAELKQPKPAEKIAEEPKDILADIKELDDADAAKFNALYEKNPVKAMLTYGGDPIKQMIAEEVKKKLPKDSTDDIQAVKEEMQWTSFKTTHPEMTDVDVDQMKIFDDPQYLGEQRRPYEDLHGLATLWKSRDQRAESIYGLMKKHPSMSFKEASTFHPEPTKAIVDKEKIKNTVNKNKKTITKKHPQKVDDAFPEINSIDEAFDMD